MNRKNTCDVLITSDDHDRLMSHLFPGDDDEHGAVLRAGVAKCDSSLQLSVQHIEPAKVGTDYLPSKFGYRALSPKFIHQQIVKCRDQRLAYLAVHNHKSENYVRFSKVDLDSHERGYPALCDIGNGVPIGALVFGRRAVAADIWLPDGIRLILGTYRVIGQTIKRFYSNKSIASKEDVIYDRQIRMFGSAGQSLLGKSKVAVVGLGGIGSLVAEYLARLGVGHLVLIDPDKIEDTNLSRVVGATELDVKSRRLKTQIAKRHAREAGGDLRLEEFPGDVVTHSIAKNLRDCDYIFLAADSMRARLLVNALTHQYLIPAVQLGAKIRANSSGELEEAMSVVRHLRPGKGCLWCNGLIDSTQLAVEAKTDEERKDQAYGVREPNPSVITLNAVSASHAINDFLFDYLNLRSTVKDTLYQHYHFLTGKTQNVIPRSDLDCYECNRRLGMGDAIELPTLF